MTESTGATCPTCANALPVAGAPCPRCASAGPQYAPPPYAAQQYAPQQYAAQQYAAQQYAAPQYAAPQAMPYPPYQPASYPPASFAAAPYPTAAHPPAPYQPNPYAVRPPKSAGVAILLTILWIGAGHLYLDRLGTGLVLMGAHVVVGFFFLIVFAPLGFLLWLAAAIGCSIWCSNLSGQINAGTVPPRETW